LTPWQPAEVPHLTTTTAVTNIWINQSTFYSGLLMPLTSDPEVYLTLSMPQLFIRVIGTGRLLRYFGPKVPSI